MGAFSRPAGSTGTGNWRPTVFRAVLGTSWNKQFYGRCQRHRQPCQDRNASAGANSQRRRGDCVQLGPTRNPVALPSMNVDRQAEVEAKGGNPKRGGEKGEGRGGERGVRERRHTQINCHQEKYLTDHENADNQQTRRSTARATFEEEGGGGWGAAVVVYPLRLGSLDPRLARKADVRWGGGGGGPL